MKKTKFDWAAFLLIIIVTIFYFRGISDVPFHPDESSKIFMSSDLDEIKSGVDRLFWIPENEKNLQQKYRELDAPLTRYLIGLGRQIAKMPGLQYDWDWSKDWEENDHRGALPSADLLLVSRISTAFLFPISMILFYFTIKRAFNRKTALIALLLLSTNPLLLLHTRRAMEESALVFATILVMFIFIYTNNPWFIGLATSLAFISKHTGGILLISGIVAVIWLKKGSSHIKTAIIKLAILIIVFTAVVWVANPFLWKFPVSAVKSAVAERQTLTLQQVDVFGVQNPHLKIGSVLQRFAGLVGGLYLTPPIIAEAGNYLFNTSQAEINYFANPMNHITSGFFTGMIILILNLIGFSLALVRFFSPPIPWKRSLGLFLFSNTVIIIFLLIFISLPFQRYYILLVPYICIWVAYAVSELLEKIYHYLRRKNAINHS